VAEAVEEARRRAERARLTGLFRYELIQGVTDPGLSARQRGALVRELAGREHDGPAGQKIAVSEQTIRRWVRDWRAGGFEALVPAPARVSARTPAEVLALAVALKKENPQRTASQVTRILRAQAGWAPSDRTMQRHFERLELNRRAGSQAAAPAAFGRFEASRPNEIWTGDALYRRRYNASAVTTAPLMSMRSSSVVNNGILLVLAPTSTWPSTAPWVWSSAAIRCGPSWPAWAAPRKVLPSTAIKRRLPGCGVVRCAAHRPASTSKASASSRCSTRRIVDSDGTRPATPSRAKVSSPASAAHSAIAAYDRARQHRAHRQHHDHHQPVPHAPAPARVSHLPQRRQQARMFPAGLSSQVSKVADDRVSL